MKKKIIAFFILLIILCSFSANALVMNVPGGNNNTNNNTNETIPHQTEIIVTKPQIKNKTKSSSNKTVYNEETKTNVTFEKTETTPIITTEVIPEESTETTIVDTEEFYTNSQSQIDISSVLLNVKLIGNLNDLSSYAIVKFDNENSKETFSLKISKESLVGTITLPLGKYSISIVDSENNQLKYDKKNIELTSSEESMLEIKIISVKKEDGFFLTIFKNSFFAISGIVISVIVFIIYKRKQKNLY